MLQSVTLYDDNLKYFNAILFEIEQAKELIYFEMYRLNNDAFGIRFRDALAKKAAEGVQVKLLLDSWGTPYNQAFVNPVIAAGGEVRFFQKLKLSFHPFSKNHRRNHRKLIIIDNRIVFFGSSNITAYSLNWRELNLRLEGPIARLFKKAFLDNYKLYKKYDLEKMRFKKNMHYRHLIIMQEIPAIARQKLKKKYEKMIAKAKHEIIIETPYFLPGFKLRKALMEAVERGVSVKILTPRHSDVLSVDIVRRRYVGMLHEAGVHICYYTPGNLHAKAVFVDNEYFSVSSANFDYRSFRYQHELSLVGMDEKISELLQAHLSETLIHCSPFDYDSWKKRTNMEKFIEWLLLPFRYFM